MEGRTLYACSFVSMISPSRAVLTSIDLQLRYRYFIRLEINSCVSVITISTCVCIYFFSFMHRRYYTIMYITALGDRGETERSRGSRVRSLSAHCKIPYNCSYTYRCNIFFNNFKWTPTVVERARLCIERFATRLN